MPSFIIMCNYHLLYIYHHLYIIMCLQKTMRHMGLSENRVPQSIHCKSNHYISLWKQLDMVGIHRFQTHATHIKLMIFTVKPHERSSLNAIKNHKTIKTIIFPAFCRTRSARPVHLIISSQTSQLCHGGQDHLSRPRRHSYGKSSCLSRGLS